MVFVYRLLINLILIFSPIILILRLIRKKEDPKRFKEKILVSHFNIKNKGKSKLIWFHAASIGEYKSIIPIIRQLNIKNNNLKFLITTTTLSSGNLATKEIENFSNVEHRYFPFDVPFLIKKFLHLWKPDNIFLVDSEIWPNLILNAKKLNIPLALINARLTPKSFDKWMIFPNEAKKIFRNFDLFICSNLRTKNYLEKLHAVPITPLVRTQQKCAAQRRLLPRSQSHSQWLQPCGCQPQRCPAAALLLACMISAAAARLQHRRPSTCSRAARSCRAGTEI